MSLINARQNPDADSLAAIYEPHQPGMLNPHANFSTEPKSPLEQINLEAMRAGFQQQTKQNKHNEEEEEEQQHEDKNKEDKMKDETMKAEPLTVEEEEEGGEKHQGSMITHNTKTNNMVPMLQAAPMEFKISNKKTDAVKVVRKRKRMTFEMAPIMTKEGGVNQKKKEEEQQQQQQQQQEEEEEDNTAAKVKHIVNSPESFMAMKLSEEQQESDKKRPYRVVTYNKEIIKANMTHDEINLQVKTRSDPANRSIPAKLYSSLKYEVEQALPRHVFLKEPKGVYMISISVVDPNNPHEEILKANETSMVAGIAQHTAMNMTKECVHVFLKLRFTDVSAHHNKRDFALRFDYFDSNMSITEPVLSIVSAPFQIYARRPKQNKKRTYTKRPTVNNTTQHNEFGANKKRKLNSGDLKIMPVEQLCEAIDAKRGHIAYEEYNKLLQHVLELQASLSPVDRARAMAAQTTTTPTKVEGLPSTESDLIHLYENQATKGSIFDIHSHFHRDDLFDDYLV